MADGGYEMGQGIASMGNSLAQYMIQYHQQHQQQMMEDEVVERLRDQVDPATHKPIFDEKAYDRYQSSSRTQKAAIFGGMEATVKASESMAKIAQEMALDKAHQQYFEAGAEYNRARAKDNPMMGQPIYDDSGQMIGVMGKNTPSFFRRGKTSDTSSEPPVPASQDPSLIEHQPNWWDRVKGVAQDVAGSFGGSSPFGEPQPEVRRAVDATTGQVAGSQQAGGAQKAAGMGIGKAAAAINEGIKKGQTSPEAAGEAVMKAGQSVPNEEMMRVQRPDGTIVRIRRNDLALLPQGWTVLGAAVE